MSEVQSAPEVLSKIDSAVDGVRKGMRKAEIELLIELRKIRRARRAAHAAAEHPELTLDNPEAVFLAMTQILFHPLVAGTSHRPSLLPDESKCALYTGTAKPETTTGPTCAVRCQGHAEIPIFD